MAELLIQNIKNKQKPRNLFFKGGPENVSVNKIV